jgi:hypothetical protein
MRSRSIRREVEDGCCYLNSNSVQESRGSGAVCMRARIAMCWLLRKRACFPTKRGFAVCCRFAVPRLVHTPIIALSFELFPAFSA